LGGEVGKSSNAHLNWAKRFSPEPCELYPDPYTREAIAYFSTSLDFHIRPRQAKSEVYDGAFPKMCLSIHEHPIWAEVGVAKPALASRTVIVVIGLHLAVVDKR